MLCGLMNFGKTVLGGAAVAASGRVEPAAAALEREKTYTVGRSFSNKGMSFIHHWTRIDLPIKFPAKFKKNGGKFKSYR